MTIIANNEDRNICQTCGTRYAGNVPEICKICADDRQYVLQTGQKWLSYNEIANGRSIRFNHLLPNLYDLRITPAFAIAQKAHLICTPEGNLLWDCIPFIDEPTIAFIKSLGGLKGIAISHPHYYSLMAVWAEIFDCPVYLHEADKQWVLDESPKIELWQGQKKALWDGMEIIHTAGHFPGSTVLHVPGINSNGSLFVGDSLYVANDRKFISMMYSYPNAIPLPKKDILQISDRVSPLKFDAMYGAFEWQNIEDGAKEMFTRSISRYLEIFK